MEKATVVPYGGRTPLQSVLSDAGYPEFAEKIADAVRRLYMVTADISDYQVFVSDRLMPGGMRSVVTSFGEFPINYDTHLAPGTFCLIRIP